MSEEINVFLSSAMNGELDIERESIKSNFETNQLLKYYFKLVYIEKSAIPKKIQEACIDEVKNSRIMILLLKNELRDAVKEEIDTAIGENVKILCYVKKESRRRSKLKSFLEKAKDYPITYVNFSDSTELMQKIIHDLKKDLNSTYLSAKALTSTQGNIIISSNRNPSYSFFSPTEILEYSNLSEISKLSVDELISNSISLLFEQGSYKLALLYLEIAASKDPSNWVVFNNIGFVLGEMGLQDKALFNYLKSISIKPSEFAFFNIGNIFMYKKNFEQAITYYEKSLELDPNKQSTLDNLTTCYIQLKKFKECLTTSEKSHSIKKTDVSIGNYSLALCYNHQLEKSLRILEDIKDKRIYYIYRAFRFYQLKNFAETLEEINKVKITDYELDMLKFYSLVRLNKKEEAMEWLKTIQEKLPINSEDYNSIGWELITEMKEFQIAIPLFEMAIQLEKFNVNAWINLQFSYLSMNQLDEAIEICDRTLILFPHETKTIKNKSAALMEKGNFEEALLLNFSNSERINNPSLSDNEIENKLTESLNFLGLKKSDLLNLAKNFFSLQQIVKNFETVKKDSSN